MNLATKYLLKISLLIGIPVVVTTTYVLVFDPKSFRDLYPAAIYIPIVPYIIYEVYIKFLAKFYIGKKIYSKKSSPVQVVSAVKGALYLVATHLFFFISMEYLFPNINFTQANFMGIFSWSVIFVIAIDFGFYIQHFMFHKIKPLYKYIHHQHHIATIPQTIHHFDQHVMEYFLSVTMLIVTPTIVHFLGFGFSSNMFYGLICALSTVAYLGSVDHTPIEFFVDERITKMFPFNIIPAYSVQHTLHHARFNENYGAYTRIWDKLFGTESPDYYEVVKRVRKGKPLTSLHERCNVPLAVKVDSKSSINA